MIRSLFLSFLLLFGLVSPVQADHSLGPRWQSWPVYVDTSRVNSPVLYNATLYGISVWNPSPVVDLIERTRKGKQTNTITIIESPICAIACTYWESIRGGHTYTVTIYLNTNVIVGAQNGYARNVLCHELGHAISLDHQPTTDTCMSGGAATDIPNAHDFDQLMIIYG